MVRAVLCSVARVAVVLFALELGDAPVLCADELSRSDALSGYAATFSQGSDSMTACQTPGQSDLGACACPCHQTFSSAVVHFLRTPHGSSTWAPRSFPPPASPPVPDLDRPPQNLAQV